MNFCVPIRLFGLQDDDTINSKRNTIVSGTYEKRNQVPKRKATFQR
tara:strand:- start:1013 stop:1150 length:138 start_codon:yes stop_codon:yes gene_type:complete